MLLLYQDEEQLGISILEHQNEDCVYINVVTACLWNTDNVCVYVYVSVCVCWFSTINYTTIQSKNSLALSSYWILSALPPKLPHPACLSRVLLTHSHSFSTTSADFTTPCQDIRLCSSPIYFQQWLIKSQIKHEGSCLVCLQNADIP